MEKTFYKYPFLPLTCVTCNALPTLRRFNSIWAVYGAKIVFNKKYVRITTNVVDSLKYATAFLGQILVLKRKIITSA